MKYLTFALIGIIALVSCQKKVATPDPVDFIANLQIQKDQNASGTVYGTVDFSWTSFGKDPISYSVSYDGGKFNDATVPLTASLPYGNHTVSLQAHYLDVPPSTITVTFNLSMY